MRIETLEVYGLIGCLESLRLPFKKEVRSEISVGTQACLTYMYGETNYFPSQYSITISSEDIKLLQKLIKAGKEHAKSLRLVRVDCKLKTTRGLWQELDTYEVGVVNGCSESTMHTIINEDLTLANFQYSPETEGAILSAIDYIKVVKDSDFTPANKRVCIKEILPESYLQERVISFSYQTLQRIIRQRKGHRLPQWQNFIKWVETLPLAEELIFLTESE